MILLVDDSSDDRELFRISAGEAGITHPIREASSGEEALDLLLREGLAPLLILLDVKMPGLDGFMVLRRLRAAPEHRKTLVVMLTGSDLESDRRQAETLGCDLFLTKPASMAGYVEAARRIKSLLP